MTPGNNDNKTEFELQRRRKADNFHLNIQDDFVASSERQNSFDELNSYSGQDVKEQIARNSKKSLKRKKREEKREIKEKNKHNRSVFRRMWLVSVLIIGIMFASFAVTGMNDLLAVYRTDPSTVVVDIPENPNLNMVADILTDKGVISEPGYFKMFANMKKAGDRFTQGTYEMRKNMDYEAIINYLLSTNNRTDTVTVMITEGQNVPEIAETLKKNGVLSNTDEFLKLCNSTDFDKDFSFLKDIKNGKNRYYKLEGYLYPDTYEFYKNQDAKSAIYRFLNNYETKMNEKQKFNGYEKLYTVEKMIEQSETEYSLDEIMNIASIIQAEAANVEDMYNISSVIHNRLSADADMGVLNLGLDSTKYYPYRSAEKVPAGKGGKDYSSKYDTYKVQGLPAGPICNPGMEAIKAALTPNSTSYYYFCHDKDGQAYYASTIYEHNANLEYIK